MTAHGSTRRRTYSERSHDVATRPPVPVYRCTVCGGLGFKVRVDSLFGYCRSCRWHRTFVVATDPEALRWAQARAIQPDALPGGSGAVASEVGAGGASSVPGQASAPPLPGADPSRPAAGIQRQASGLLPPASAPADPFYPEGTDW